MGLQANRIIRIMQYVNPIEGHKSLCLLGVQIIHIEWEDFIYKARCFDLPLKQDILEEIKGKYPIDTYKFFEMLGFSEVHAIDISDYEGADIILDLNQECSEEFKEKFDVIIDGGTLEHVFNIPNAMRVLCGLLKPNGTIIHGSPLSGYVDHGFYSISPTFYLDFYRQNGYRIINSEIEFVLDAKEKKHARWNSIYSQDCRLFSQWGKEGCINDYVATMASNQNIRRMVLWTAARKIKADTCIKYPFQSMWNDYEGWDDGRKH